MLKVVNQKTAIQNEQNTHSCRMDTYKLQQAILPVISRYDRHGLTCNLYTAQYLPGTPKHLKLQGSMDITQNTWL